MRTNVCRRNLFCYAIVSTSALLNTYLFIHNYVKLQRDLVKPKSSRDTLLPCTNRTNEPFVEERGIYLVYYNYIAATESFACHESVTLTTHGEAFYIYENLEPLTERWRGPISMSVFTLGYDYHNALSIIMYLRECKSELIKRTVSFHFVFQEMHFPENIINPINVSSISVNCTTNIEKLLKQKSYRSGSNETYPINVARNAARRAAITYFVLPSDIELYPSYNFIINFLKFIEKNPAYIHRDPVAVFVLPIFEVAENMNVPKSKSELVTMLRNKSAVVFHQFTCPVCQRFPEVESWKKAKEKESFNALSSTKRQGKFESWEPIYVASNEVPYYDERLSWEGTKDKMSQMYLLCLLNYDFMVLDNAFLVHRPGIKKVGISFKGWRGERIAPQLKRVYKQIKREYDALHGTRRGCVM